MTLVPGRVVITTWPQVAQTVIGGGPGVVVSQLVHRWCSRNVHVWACEHVEACQCGQATRVVPDPEPPPRCPGCGR